MSIYDEIKRLPPISKNDCWNVFSSPFREHERLKNEQAKRTKANIFNVSMVNLEFDKSASRRASILNKMRTDHTRFSGSRMRRRVGRNGRMRKEPKNKRNRKKRKRKEKNVIDERLTQTYPVPTKIPMSRRRTIWTERGVVEAKPKKLTQLFPSLLQKEHRSFRIRRKKGNHDPETVINRKEKIERKKKLPRKIVGRYGEVLTDEQTLEELLAHRKHKLREEERKERILEEQLRKEEIERKRKEEEEKIRKLDELTKLVQNILPAEVLNDEILIYIPFHELILPDTEQGNEVPIPWIKRFLLLGSLELENEIMQLENVTNRNIEGSRWTNLILKSAQKRNIILRHVSKKSNGGNLSSSSSLEEHQQQDTSFILLVEPGFEKSVDYEERSNMMIPFRWFEKYFNKFHSSFGRLFRSVELEFSSNKEAKRISRFPFRTFSRFLELENLVRLDLTDLESLHLQRHNQNDEALEVLKNHFSSQSFTGGLKSLELCVMPSFSFHYDVPIFQQQKQEEEEELKKSQQQNIDSFIFNNLLSNRMIWVNLTNLEIGFLSNYIGNNRKNNFNNYNLKNIFFQSILPKKFINLEILVLYWDREFVTGMDLIPVFNSLNLQQTLRILKFGPSYSTFIHSNYPKTFIDLSMGRNGYSGDDNEEEEEENGSSSFSSIILSGRFKRLQLLDISTVVNWKNKITFEEIKKTIMSIHNNKINNFHILFQASPYYHRHNRVGRMIEYLQRKFLHPNNRTKKMMKKKNNNYLLRFALSHMKKKSRFLKKWMEQEYVMKNTTKHKIVRDFCEKKGRKQDHSDDDDLLFIGTKNMVQEGKGWKVKKQARRRKDCVR